jgi:hypothetical protein
VLPKHDVYQLMRASVAVLNASLFEGLGLTTHEAAALGKRMILSDIAVHHEIEGVNAVYFDAQHAGQLAKCLQDVQHLPEGPDLPLEAACQAAQEKRQRASAESFMAICTERHS